MTSIRVVQDKGATLTVWVATLITRLTFPREFMPDDIYTLASWTKNRFYYHGEE
jgi:hypothetical protein